MVINKVAFSDGIVDRSCCSRRCEYIAATAFSYRAVAKEVRRRKNYLVKS